MLKIINKCKNILTNIYSNRVNILPYEKTIRSTMYQYFYIVRLFLDAFFQYLKIVIYFLCSSTWIRLTHFLNRGEYTHVFLYLIVI
jgi:hypothetical protein